MRRGAAAKTAYGQYSPASPSRGPQSAAPAGRIGRSGPGKNVATAAASP